MHIHEHHAKKLMQQQGLPVPAGQTASQVDACLHIADTLGYPVVIKAQVLAGGRGKAGGIKVTTNPSELQAAASTILGMQLTNAQTGPEGLLVKQVLVEKGADIDKEFYLALISDRSHATFTLIVSPAGGMEIETVAAHDPAAVTHIQIDPLMGLQRYQLQQASGCLGLTGSAQKQLFQLISQLYQLFTQHDLLLAEINPLIQTQQGTLQVLDAKLEIDPNSLFRHPEFTAVQEQETTGDPLERAAQSQGLNYLRLAGNVGIMVNGAGLAMATMDMIHATGAKAANFLDVGGGASSEMICHGFQILLQDPQVKVILINIFGGIMRCDLLAQGVVEAAQQVGLSVPVIVRLAGTHAEAGQQILADSGLPLTPVQSLTEATEQIIALEVS